MSTYSSTNLNKYSCTHAFVKKRMVTFFDNINSFFGMVKGEKLLNLGCGEGFDIKHIYEKSHSATKQCFGVDLSIDALKIARNMLPHFQFNAVCGDICDLPIKLDKFDLVLCLEVLEHLEFPEKALKEIAQQFNGHCLFSVPNEPLYRLTRMALFRLNVRQFGNHPEHINHWSRRQFARLITKYFKIDKIASPFPWTIILCHNGPEREG